MDKYISYRPAVPQDAVEINKLYNQCFYPQVNYLPDVFVGRYWVAVNEHADIVGVVGLATPEESDFDDWEIARLAVSEKYRNLGIATALVKFCIDNTTGKLYASAWRTDRRWNMAHAHGVLNRYGFQKVDTNTKHWMRSIHCKYAQCPYSNERCECWDDTYVLDRR